jgi:Na+-driven multidrug efflux pump
VTTTQERWWPDRLALSQLFSVGWPLVARTVALIGTITFAASLATHLGTVEFAAFAVAFSLWQFATYMVDGLEVAGQSLVAHARGRDAANSRLIARRILTWALRLGIGLGIIIVLARPWLAGLITSDPKVITRASSMLVWVALLQPVGAVAFAVDGILVGMARQRAMAAAMIGSALAFVLASHIFPTETAGWAIWASFAVFMTLRTGCGLTDIWFWSHRAPSGMRRRAACPIDTAPCSEATDTPPRASP